MNKQNNQRTWTLKGSQYVDSTQEKSGLEIYAEMCAHADTPKLSNPPRRGGGSGGINPWTRERMDDEQIHSHSLVTPVVSAEDFMTILLSSYGITGKHVYALHAFSSVWLGVTIYTASIFQTLLRCAPLEVSLIRLQEVAYQPSGSLCYSHIFIGPP